MEMKRNHDNIQVGRVYYVRNLQKERMDK
ncbi:DUF1317 family protein [Photorhabdus viridis]